MNSTSTCDFCGKEITEVKKIFSSEVSHICDECVTMCSKVLEKELIKDSKKEFQKGLSVPIKIKEHLDDYVIGQDEAKKVLAAGGLRSTIGCYWNAVVDDLRRKIIHTSIDLFNKEYEQKREIKTYEDFQNYVIDIDLIEGAYKIGAIGWEAKKLLQQARETRNIFDGHPESSDPTYFKVFDMISDCNR